MIVLLLTAACTYVPFDAPRSEPVAARPQDSTTASRQIASDLAERPGQSGFHPLSDGNDALGARLSMIDAAEQRIDLQSFLIKPDMAGSLISLALLRAADRGVAVRLLFDDVFTTASDRQIAYLDAHSRIEVRLFNPLSRQSPTAVNYMLDFERVNRRMHNKVFLVDNAMGIVGGRNVADEYYRIDTATDFADFDIFVAGPVVDGLVDAFDLFWSDRYSVPVSALRRNTELIDPSEVRRALEEEAADGADEIYRAAVNAKYLKDIREGRILPVFGKARAVTDTPDKLRTPVVGGKRVLGETLMQRISRAETQVTILTPYFVPERWGQRLLSDMAARGVRVRVVTNSLAANNHPYVHGGYAPYRRPLLEAGVELYEVRADAPEVLGGAEVAKLTMHTKLVVVDEDTTFIGSMNFDPRSIKLNSEMGLFIESQLLARGAIQQIDEAIAAYTFRVSLDSGDDLQWTWEHGGRRQVFGDEPGASFVQKAIAGVTRLLPVEGQL